MHFHCGVLNPCFPPRRSSLSGLILFLLAAGPAVAAVNSWTKPISGFWEEQAFWSLGVLPDAAQDVEFNNPGWKALAIGSTTAQDFPQSMRVKSVRVESPVDSFNTLLMTFAGYERPLFTESMVVGSNSVVVMHASLLEVTNTTADGSTGNLLLSGTFRQGDFSGVKVHGNLLVRSGGAYFMTNGTLAALGVSVGNFAPGQFSQYGGFNNLGSLQVNTSGEFHLYGGELTASNGITVGTGDFASTSRFVQYGGSVEANTVINGHYVLSGGIAIGRMSVPGNTFQRVNGSVLQTGGTNLAAAMDLGFPNRFGGAAIYVLSNGVVRVDSSTIFQGGWFSQYDGLHTIASNFVMRGRFVGPGNVYAEYFLGGGTLQVGELAAQTAIIRQEGGSNLIAGELILNAAPSDPFSPPTPAGLYTLSGGFLSARNIILNPVHGGGFRQSGGASQIAEKLTVEGGSSGSWGYVIAGGTLTVKDIQLGAGGSFQHTNGTINHSGILGLNHGEWRAASGNHALGALRLSAEASSNSAIVFPAGSSVLRLANSSAETWSPTVFLLVTNWHGSASGGGETQLFFGSNMNGLTPQQLARIRFSIAGGLFLARILATGEIVPQMHGQSLAFSRSGDNLTLNWEPGWTLQSSTNVAGPYEDVPGAASPYAPPMDSLTEFFRLRQ